MPLQLDDIRREFAAHLARQPDERFSMDKALAHVVTKAYEVGLIDGAVEADASKVSAGETASEAA